MNIALILARSGSKRIKNKNIKKFKKKPIIYWTIKNIKESKKFNKIIVSTDKKSIAKLVNKFGAETPFIRPKNISGDRAGTKEVVNHAIRYFEEKNFNVKNIACFYATSIFAKPELIRKSFKFLSRNIKFVFIGKKIDAQLYRAVEINNNRIVKNSSNKNNFRTQDIKKKYYQDLGQFYLASYETWKKEKIIICKNSKLLELKKWEASDIDDIDDWKLSEKLFKKK
jgi:N-acylneuraminate cytidylyltransferase